MPIINTKERALRPFFLFSISRFHNIQDNRYSVFIIIPHNSLISVCSISFYNSISLGWGLWFLIKWHCILLSLWLYYLRLFLFFYSLLLLLFFKSLESTWCELSWLGNNFLCLGWFLLGFFSDLWMLLLDYSGLLWFHFFG